MVATGHLLVILLMLIIPNMGQTLRDNRKHHPRRKTRSKWAINNSNISDQEHMKRPLIRVHLNAVLPAGTL